MSKKMRTVPFEVGDSVRVKEGVKDPDNPDWNIDGWQGRIIEVTRARTPMILVAWDSITLKNMPASIIEACEEEGLDWSQFSFFPSDVEAATPRDRAQDVKAIKNKLHDQHWWASLGEEGRRIQQVLAGVRPGDPLGMLRAWEDHLTVKLTFPFDAVIDEFQEYGPLYQGDEVHVFGISEVDGDYGLIASVRHEKGRYHLPMADLEVRDKGSPNYQPLHDYSVWFANH